MGPYGTTIVSGSDFPFSDWTSRPKEALLWGKRASRARLPRPVIRRGLPGWRRRDYRGAKPKEAPK